MRSKKPFARSNVDCGPFGSCSALLKIAPGTIDLVAIARADMKGLVMLSNISLGYNFSPVSNCELEIHLPIKCTPIQRSAGAGNVVLRDKVPSNCDLGQRTIVQISCHMNVISLNHRCAEDGFRFWHIVIISNMEKPLGID